MISKGSRVSVPKGTLITGTFPGKAKRAKRTYTVTVFAYDVGYAESTLASGREDRVCWVGGAGYWHYALASEVIKVDCEHTSVRGHTPYDGKADCCDCKETVWLNPKIEEPT